MKRRFLWCAIFLSTVCLVACGKKQDGGEADPSAKTDVSAKENIKQLKELKKIDVKVGKGPEARTGDLVSMVYTGKLKNGLQFDSNDNPDAAPYVFVLGTQAVIPGWDMGIPGMKVGGVRKIEVPNKYAYGDNPQGDKVPPGADLYFEVKLVDVVRAEDAESFEKKDLIVGSGRTCKLGDLVDVNYTMTLVNGKLVDKYLDPKSPVTFRVGPRTKDGEREVPRGIFAAMVGMKEGGKRWMRIPPPIGFAYSSNSKLPANNVVLIEMTLLKIH